MREEERGWPEESSGWLSTERNRRRAPRRRSCCLLCRWFCCCCGCCYSKKEHQQYRHMSSGDRHATASGHGGRLPDEVYKQIRAVEQQTSTLTQAGISGFSARVLDRQEHPHPHSKEGGIVIQLVEIIKKPGQSLGLYLREGNGYDRPNGVFASRFGENSELERYGDVIRPGDEILSINNVEVATMSIDDVVLTLSIPRRLILKIRYLKHRRDRPTNKPVDRPVVVFHKVEETRGDPESNAPLLSNPTPTANTWVGRRARQQQQEMQQRMSHPPARSTPPGTSSSHPLSHPSSSIHSARLLNGKSDHVSELTRFSDPEPLDTVSRTARVHPPKIYSSTVRRAESFSSQPGVSTSSPGYTLPRSSTACPPPDPLLSRSLCSPVLPRPLRAMDSYSNSLPRRRAVSGPRNVKWRNDVIGPDTSDLFGEDSDGAISAPEYGGRHAVHPMRLSNGGPGRTINDIFSAAEYRNWAGVPDQRTIPFGGGGGIGAGAFSTMGRQSRWSHTYGDPRAARSSSLSNRSMMAQSLVGSPLTSRAHPPMERPSAILDRYHVSPLMNRRAPLRPAGPGINVDRLNVHALSGMLYVQIYDGRGLRIPEKHRLLTEEMYCVLEVDEAHRARTGVSTAEQKYRWRETFHIDIYNATQLQFFVYSWHPQHRHNLCHKGSLKLLEAFIVDQLNGEKMLALNLEPRGQLCVRVGFHDMHAVFRRTVNPRIDGVFGVSLTRLLQRERRETPLVLTRLIQEIERRGVDYGGLYILCGAVEKKRVVREELERNTLDADISLDGVPDTNVLACLIKDFLRELPDPLIPPHIHNMLLDANSIALPNDIEGNRQLVFRIIDCLSLSNKNTLLLIMDHLSLVLSSFCPPSGVPRSLLNTIFAPLIFCTVDTSGIGGDHRGIKEPLVRPLDVGQAANTLQLLFDVWPTRVNGSDSSSAGTAPCASNSVSESQC